MSMIADVKCSASLPIGGKCHFLSREVTDKFQSISWTRQVGSTGRSLVTQFFVRLKKRQVSKELFELRGKKHEIVDSFREDSKRRSSRPLRIPGLH